LRTALRSGQAVGSGLANVAGDEPVHW
jgi:hypothetical protein